MSWKDKFKPKPKRDLIDAAYWRKIWWDKKAAKHALVNLQFPATGGGFTGITKVDLADGSTIPVADVSEEQAQEFMRSLCPDWAFNEASKNEKET